MPEGGARPGAGRPKGSKNHRRQVRIPAKTIENGLLPLDYMLAMMRDDQIEPQRRDYMAIQCAPYIHPRLGAVLQASIPGRDMAEEAATAVNIISIPRGGRIDPKTGVVTAPEIVPVKPYESTPLLELSDQRAPEPVQEPLPVIEIDTSNVTPLRRRDDE